jgi:hypothetical protein
MVTLYKLREWSIGTCGSSLPWMVIPLMENSNQQTLSIKGFIFRFCQVDGQE